MKFDLTEGIFTPIIPQSGGGLSLETHLWEYTKRKYIVRKCKSEKKARSYVFISKKLSRYNILPKLIKRKGKNVIYEYLHGRNLKKNERLKIFEQVGEICAKINNTKILTDVKINTSFYKQLKGLETGNYKKFTLGEMKEKRKRRPKERYNIKRIKPLITSCEKSKIKKINNSLIIITKAKVCFDAFDVSPANFRLSKGKVYFVDIGGIKSTLRGMGLAKGLWGWAQTEKQRSAIIKGYFLNTKKTFSQKYLNLIKLHYLIQSLHDRVKLGRDYNTQLIILRSFLKNYPMI